ncbi:MAG: hypothetical protein LBE36_11555, partial [Flavobacteriaceae bacterium]|nr:hypothetical protein [Flavobacteriaceae bacterium]
WDHGEAKGTATKDKEPTIEKPDGRSMASVGKTEPEKKEEECFCKKKENQFHWSNKLTCEQRKKVLQVCAELWGEKDKSQKASELMSIMHLETGGSFSPSADNQRGYIGLIQFSKAAAESVGTTQAKLREMTFVQQMDYVKKYFEKSKDKLKTFEDFYLQVMKPNAVGNGNNPNYVIFDESVSVPDGDGSKHPNHKDS